MKVLLWLRRYMTIQVMIALAVLAVLSVVNIIWPHTPQSIFLSGLVGTAAIGAIVDAQTQLSLAQALTAGTTASTNSYDSLLATNNIAAGEELSVEFTVDVAASGTSVQVQIIQSANANLSAPDVLVSTDVTFMNTAFFSAGKRFTISIPENLKTKRYLGVQYILTAATVTMTAYMMPSNFTQNEQVYPKNFLITS